MITNNTAASKSYMPCTRLGKIRNLPTYQPPTPRTSPEPENPWFSQNPAPVAHFDPQDFHADLPNRRHPLKKDNETIVFKVEIYSKGVRHVRNAPLARVKELCQTQEDEGPKITLQTTGEVHLTIPTNQVIQNLEHRRWAAPPVRKFRYPRRTRNL